MSDCEITFSGTGGGTYTVPADQVKYISKDMINTGYSGTIYLYPSGSVQSTRQNYIALQPGLYPRYYTSSSYNYTEITNAADVTFNVKAQFYRNRDYIEIGLWFIITFYVLVRLFRGGKT